MANTLASVGHIVGSLLNPLTPTVITSTGTATKTADPAEMDTGQDITLGKPKGRQGPAKTDKPKIEALTSAQQVISPAFKLLVIIVFVLVLLTGLATVLLALFGSERATTQSAFSVMSTAFTGSLGAILGLIGGKAV